MQQRRPNVEVRFSQLEHLSDVERGALESRAIAYSETPVLRADREPSREEVETIREVVRTANNFWRKLGVEGPVVEEAQCVPVRSETLAQYVAAQSEFHREFPIVALHNHVYYPPSRDEGECIRQLSHELSHLAAKNVVQVEANVSAKIGAPITQEAKVRQRREGGRFAATVWEDDFETRGFEGYHEAIMELIASEVRHMLFDARGVAKDAPERSTIAPPFFSGPSPRLIENIMDAYIRDNPGVATRRQLKDEAYLDARNGTYAFIKRLHAWKPDYIKPLAQMGLTYMSMRDTAKAVGEASLAAAIEEYRVANGIE